MTTAPAVEVAGTLTSGVGPKRGAVVSVISTVKLWVARLPEASVACIWTVVVPRGKVVPEGGVKVTRGVASQASLALPL